MSRRCAVGEDIRKVDSHFIATLWREEPKFFNVEKERHIYRGYV